MKQHGTEKDGNRVVNPASSAAFRAGLERILDMDEVAGSSPAPPTNAARPFVV